MKKNRGFTLAEVLLTVGIASGLIYVIGSQLGYFTRLQEGVMTTANLEDSVRILGKDLKFQFERGRRVGINHINYAGNANDPAHCPSAPQHPCPSYPLNPNLPGHPPDPALDPVKPKIGVLVDFHGSMVLESDTRECGNTTNPNPNVFNPSNTDTHLTKFIYLCCSDLVTSKGPINVLDSQGNNVSIVPNCPKPGLVVVKMQGTTQLVRTCYPEFKTFSVVEGGFDSVNNATLYHINLEGQTKSANGSTPWGGVRVRGLEVFRALGNTGSGAAGFCRENL